MNNNTGMPTYRQNNGVRHHILCAVRSEQIDTIKAILDAGAEIKKKNRDNMSALMLSIGRPNKNIYYVLGEAL